MMDKQNNVSVDTAYLILEDGTTFKGKSFGAKTDVVGEVVFNTGMTGYQEVLSDPSYCGQIVTMTYPLIGNYGITRDDFESLYPAISGLIVKEHATFPNHWRKETTIDELLKEKGIPGLYGIDTRKLTRIIREHGAMKGKIYTKINDTFSFEHALIEVKQTDLKHNQIAQVSTKSSFHCPGRGLRIILVDFGSKAGIVRELTKRHCDVRVVPYNTSAEEILRMRPDGVVLSNGPGDPKDVPQVLTMIRALLGEIPMFSICMGHQLFALACGADTEKMKFGHRGANHPVQDLDSQKVMMTSQNHSYTVSLESLKGTRLKMTHHAINDRTVEGLRHLDHPAFSVQFHPEAAPGPFDSEALFDDFINMVEEYLKKGESRYATR